MDQYVIRKAESTTYEDWGSFLPNYSGIHSSYPAPLHFIRPYAHYNLDQKKTG